LKIGINLPAQIPNVPGDLLVEWAKRADDGPFSSVGAIDRIAYLNYEPMVTLAAAAAVTKRVRLVTNVLVATLRNPGVLAKEAASIDAISNGRLTLGVGVGARGDDFRAAPASFKDRGKRFEEQLDLMKRIWKGEPAVEGDRVVGPAPVRKGGPELLIGARSPSAIARVGKWADGYLAPPYQPDVIKGLWGQALDSWKANGRQGSPRLVGVYYFTLGPDAEARGRAYLEHYWAFNPAAADDYMRDSLFSPEAIREMAKGLEAIGMDELLLMPCVAEFDQLERAADVVASLA
jgi:alkanesulfonate monooxygenase SsuD/methylene tetrahydromethanopterin reductase-like flavin-dependent oxidoreductase (luciferase family)